MYIFLFNFLFSLFFHCLVSYHHGIWSPEAIYIQPWIKNPQQKKIIIKKMNNDKHQVSIIFNKALYSPKKNTLLNLHSTKINNTSMNNRTQQYIITGVDTNMHSYL